MGCYGIGISRCMGVIVEKSNDANGIIWPESVAPFQIELISLKGAEEYAQETYQKLRDQGVEVLWDDRDESPGSKFADADLMGIPYRVVISTRNADKLEFKKRDEENSELIDFDTLVEKLNK